MKTHALAMNSKRTGGFSLLELLVSMSVLILILGLLDQMFSGTAMLINYHDKTMDVDAQARMLLDRMGIDFSTMVKRTDVNYYLKSDTAESTNPQNYNLTSANPMTAGSGLPGNDQIAFYSSVAGYYSSTTTSDESTLSLVGYRLNTTTYQMQRFGRGLFWNGAPGTTSSGSSASGDQPAFLPVTFGATGQWPAAISATTTDADYETLAPGVFRFEYYYLLKSGVLSTIPWDVAAGHTSLNGLQDIAAIGVTIAAIDSKSRLIVSNSTLANLALQMRDYNATTMTTPGAMETQWRAVLQGTSVPASARPSLHIYHRFFLLNSH